MVTKKQMFEELVASMGNPVEDTIQNVTGIFYGESGGGKTITAIRLGQAICDVYGGEILMLDAVNAWRSVKNHPDLHHRLTRIPYSGKVQLDTIVEAIEFQQPPFDKFKVIILDEMSSMTDKDGDVVLAAAAADPKNDGKDPDVLTQPDMGKTTERMRRTVTALLKQDISVIFVAHQRQDEDKALGYKTTRPRFMPKFSGTIREGLDFVVHCTAVESNRGGNEIHYVRKIQCNPTKTVVAKSRVGGVGLYETPESFIQATIAWMQGKVGDSTVDTIVDDRPLEVGEVSDEFATTEVE